MAVGVMERARRVIHLRSGLAEADFRALYREQLGPVLSYARYRLGAPDADDVAAEVFTRAWAARASYDAGHGPPVAWLWAIARNAVIDRLRCRRPAPADLPPDLPDEHDPPDEIARRDEWRRLGAAIARLAELDQEIIALRFGAGHTNRAIAAMLDLSESNVAQRLRRALRKLRLELEGTGVG